MAVSSNPQQGKVNSIRSQKKPRGTESEERRNHAESEGVAELREPVTERVTWRRERSGETMHKGQKGGNEEAGRKLRISQARRRNCQCVGWVNMSL